METWSAAPRKLARTCRRKQAVTDVAPPWRDPFGDDRSDLPDPQDAGPHQARDVVELMPMSGRCDTPYVYALSCISRMVSAIIVRTFPLFW
jgi:hypothetical protein